MKLYGGIDGGGSKTLAIVLDESGREVGRAVTAGSNCQVVGVEQAARHILQAVSLATGENLPLAGVCMGLAGVDRPDDKAAMSYALTELAVTAPSNLWLGNDAELILLALPGGLGLGLIAGTGSIALGRDSTGQLVRAGGWGHLIGDEGSGYDLGRRAVQAAAQAADRRGPQTSLLSAILQEWNLSQPPQLITVAYNSSTRVAEFARLARLVSAQASAGDAVAQSLLKGAAHDLARAVEAVAWQLNFSEPPGLAIAGGLILHEKALRRILRQRLARTLKIGPVVKVPEPAWQAAHSALNLFNSSSS